jgi:hypothetical protein
VTTILLLPQYPALSTQPTYKVFAPAEKEVMLDDDDHEVVPVITVPAFVPLSGVPILHAQDDMGFVPCVAVPLIAKELEGIVCDGVEIVTDGGVTLAIE